MRPTSPRHSALFAVPFSFLALSSCSIRNSPTPAQAPRASTPQVGTWGYRVETIDLTTSGGLFHARAVLDSTLQQAGADGWELVSIIQPTEANPQASAQSSLLVVLKRPTKAGAAVR